MGKCGNDRTAGEDDACMGGDSTPEEALFLTLTAGVAVTYAIYQTMNYMGAKFWFPIFPFLGATLVLLAVCITVPVLAYRRIEKSGSLVERIRVAVE